MNEETTSTNTKNGRALFGLGMTVATKGAIALLQRTGTEPIELLKRHVTGDFGDLLCNDDAERNRWAVDNDARIFSAYRVAPGDDGRIWVITEADRSATTMLLPTEY